MTSPSTAPGQRRTAEEVSTNVDSSADIHKRTMSPISRSRDGTGEGGMIEEAEKVKTEPSDPIITDQHYSPSTKKRPIDDTNAGGIDIKGTQTSSSSSSLSAKEGGVSGQTDHAKRLRPSQSLSECAGDDDIVEHMTSEEKGNARPSVAVNNDRSATETVPGTVPKTGTDSKQVSDDVDNDEPATPSDGTPTVAKPQGSDHDDGGPDTPELDSKPVARSPAMSSSTTEPTSNTTTNPVTAPTRAQSCWGDEDDYDSMPKTPIAPPSRMRRQSTGGSASAASSTSDLSSIAAGSAATNSSNNTSDDVLSRTMSPALYVPEVPPAPPSTPASTTPYGGRSVLQRDLSSATPLPYYNTNAPFVQNARLLERQQLLADGAVTPAPGRRGVEDGGMTPASTAPGDDGGVGQKDSQGTNEGTQRPGSIPKKPRELLSDDFTEWAVGDRYQLERMLGRGSYGEVAQAIDLQRSGGTVTGDQPDASATTGGNAQYYVAIKRIQSPFDQEVDAVRLFRELHILRRLRGHDCIIQLLDVVQPPSDDLDDFHDLYLVFEYVDTDLYKLIMSPQYLTTEHIQTFLYQMLAGLKYIHSANCIHRDLKPANILLNEDCSLKICDFGLARIVDETAVMTSSGDDKPNAERMDKSVADPPSSFADLSPKKIPLQRQLTKHVVTRWYRAPELILIQPYTSAVDIWSLGCIFAELLSMQEGSVPGYQDRSPIFPGGACYPLSGDTDNAERLDQLSVIFGVIGTPSEDDIKSIGKAHEYIKTIGTIEPKKLQSLYPAADPVAIDLLERMLKFNPRRRITASEALDHEFFRGIRRKEFETVMSHPLESPPFLNEQHVNIDVLKRKTYEEVLWFKDQVPPNEAMAKTDVVAS